MLGADALKTIPIAVLTGIGAYGGFPEPPKWFKKFANFRFFQFIVLWILIYQGGGGEHPIVTSIVAIVIYLIMEISKFLESKYEKKEPVSTYLKEPVPTYLKEPVSTYLKEPVPTYLKEPVSTYLKEPVPTYLKEPVSTYLKEPVPTYLKEPVQTPTSR